MPTARSSTSLAWPTESRHRILLTPVLIATAKRLKRRRARSLARTWIVVCACATARTSVFSLVYFHDARYPQLRLFLHSGDAEPEVWRSRSPPSPRRLVELGILELKTTLLPQLGGPVSSECVYNPVPFFSSHMQGRCTEVSFATPLHE